MSTVSKPLKATLLATVALGAGALLYNRSSDLEPVTGPTFPLSFTDDEGTSTATTWLAPPVTRDPFATPEGLAVEQAPEFDPPTEPPAAGATVGGEVVDQAPTTVPARITTTIDQRTDAEVFASRLPSTTPSTTADSTP